MKAIIVAILLSPLLIRSSKIVLKHEVLSLEGIMGLLDILMVMALLWLVSESGEKLKEKSRTWILCLSSLYMIIWVILDAYRFK
jgi:hypothetical protein